jgi:double-stranded uracil-DNA glycosylase
MPRRPKSPLPEHVPARSADYVESFPPRIGSHCRVLILGSMPGVRSLAAAQYYAHPQNQFWPLMQALFGVERDLPYAQRLRRLNDAGVGLWDVLQGCERRGSLDSDIAPGSEIPNAIPALLQQHAEIRALAFNGGKAEQAFRRHVLAQLPISHGIQLLALPSTSPAHAGMRAEEKLRRWSVLRPLLGLPPLPETVPDPRD